LILPLVEQGGRPDPPLSQALARAYSNWMADVSSQAPDRMKWVTVIDFHDPAEAAREIARTKDMGSLGVMVSGVVGDRPITHPDFEPIWAAAAETDMSVAVHPMVASTHYGDNLFHFSVLAGFKHLVMSGVLDRYPNLRVGFLETSCTWVDFMVWRTEESIDQIAERHAVGISTGRRLPELKPEEYLQTGRLFFGFEAEDAMLPYVVQRWGPDTWLYASDIPHAHRILDATSHIWAREDLNEGDQAEAAHRQHRPLLWPAGSQWRYRGLSSSRPRAALNVARQASTSRFGPVQSNWLYQKEERSAKGSPP